VTDRRAARGALASKVADAVRGGVDWVQIREKQMDGAELLELAERVADSARSGARERGGEVRVLVNRRVDVALALAADGVHLGFDALPAGVARELLGPDALVGISCHAPAELAAEGGASYAQLAPIFPPVSKRAAGPPLGLEALRAAAGGRLPVLAQGGIDASNAGAAVAAGAAGVAVTGALLLAKRPERAARELRQVLDAQAGAPDRPGRSPGSDGGGDAPKGGA
jgi:thiamine-phosphate pyrophosphorylase